MSDESSGFSWNLLTAARTLWQEARGEPLAGQQAVAHVLCNRVHDGRWGATLGEVCLWHMQFDGWRNADPNFGRSIRLQDDDPVLVALGNLMSAALGGEVDPTNGATHYFATSIPAPAWVAGDPAHGIPPAAPCGQFGHQLFFKNVR